MINTIVTMMCVFSCVEIIWHKSNLSYKWPLPYVNKVTHQGHAVGYHSIVFPGLWNVRNWKFIVELAFLLPISEIFLVETRDLDLHDHASRSRNCLLFYCIPWPLECQKLKMYHEICLLTSRDRKVTLKTRDLDLQGHTSTSCRCLLFHLIP